MLMGRQAKALPPAWDGGRIAIPVCGPQGQFIGKMLPGRGLLLYDDLQNLGITKPLPDVFERSLAFHLRDLLRSERGAISTYAGLLSARASNKHGFNSTYSKAVNITANQWGHTFQSSSNFPGAGSYTAITGGAAHDQTSAGALSYGFAHPTNPDKAYLVSFSGSTTINGWLQMVLIDLLVAAGNIDANTNSTQTVNTTALTRSTGGAGVLAFIDVTSALSTTASNLTITKYTNQGGTANQASPANAMITSAAAQKVATSTCVPFFGLQAGDYGIKSIEEVQFSAAMGGTGKVAICLCKPLMWIPALPGGVGAKRDDMSNINGAVELSLTSGNLIGCFSLLICSSATGSMNYTGDIEIAVG